MSEGNFRTPNPRILLFAAALALFVLVWPLDRRMLFFTEYSFVTGAYTEATTLSLYASDIAFLALWAAWLWYAVGHPRRLPKPVLWGGFAFLTWVFLRAIPVGLTEQTGFSAVLAWYGAARIAQGFLLVLIVAHAWPVPLLRRAILVTLVVSGSLQGLLVFGQVLRGSDLGLRFLGEHPLSLDTPGVAKVDIRTQKFSNSNVPTGTKVLRGYGTFPHPNVTASFLLGSLFASSFLSWKHRGTLETLLVSLGALFSSVGLLATFSRSSWVSFVFLLSGSLACSYRNLPLFRRSLQVLPVVLGLIVPLVFFPETRSAALARVSPGESDAFIRGRISSFQDIYGVLSSSWVSGVGVGNGFLSVVRNIDKTVEYGLTDPRQSWEYQYPHNMFLVILLELGVVGLFLFVAFLFVAARSVVSAGWSEFAAPGATMVVAVVLTGLALLMLASTDHYLWTIQQGRILLWGFLGVLLGSTARGEGSAVTARQK